MAEKRRYGPRLIDCKLGPGQNEHCLRLQLKYHNKNGGAGNRTPCLSHAKRALYHMSYTPSFLSSNCKT